MATAGRERPRIKPRDGGAGVAGGTGSRYLDARVEHGESRCSPDQRVCYGRPLHQPEPKRLWLDIRKNWAMERKENLGFFHSLFETLEIFNPERDMSYIH